MLPPFTTRTRTRRAALAAAVVVPLLASAVHVPALAAADRPDMKRDVPSSTHKVTLVTGDVVTLTTLADGRQIADVHRPVDAVGGVRMQTRGHDLYVIPDEA